MSKKNQKQVKSERAETPLEMMLRALLSFDYDTLEDFGEDKDKFQETAFYLFDIAMLEIKHTIENGDANFGSEIATRERCQVIINFSDDTIDSIIVQYVPVATTIGITIVPAYHQFEQPRLS